MQVQSSIFNYLENDETLPNPALVPLSLLPYKFLSKRFFSYQKKNEQAVLDKSSKTHVNPKCKT